MQHYQIINKEAKITVAEYSADSPKIPNEIDPAYVGEMYATIDDSDNEVNVGIVVRIWPSWEFKRRFTRDERIALRAAAQADSIISDLLDIADSAPEIRSDDLDVTLAIAHAVAEGYITSGRAHQILNGE